MDLSLLYLENPDSKEEYQELNIYHCESSTVKVNEVGEGKDISFSTI